MKKLKKSKPNAHPARKIFKNNDIPLTEVSRTLKLNYSYVCSMLAGSRPVPYHINRKFYELARIVIEKFGRQQANDQTVKSDNTATGVQLG